MQLKYSPTFTKTPINPVVGFGRAMLCAFNHMRYVLFSLSLLIVWTFASALIRAVMLCVMLRPAEYQLNCLNHTKTNGRVRRTWIEFVWKKGMCFWSRLFLFRIFSANDDWISQRMVRLWSFIFGAYYCKSPHSAVNPNELHRIASRFNVDSIDCIVITRRVLLSC